MFNAVTINITATTCAMCGAVFGMAEHLFNRRKEDGLPFFCPNGHSLNFGPSELSKTQAKLTSTLSKLEFAEADLSRERSAHQQTARKLKKHAKA